MTYAPKGLALDIFKKRYAYSPDETYQEACERVAKHVSAAENDDNRQEVYEQFFSILSENQFMPGGRIFYGSGRPKGQLLNCFVLGTADSREGWGQTVSDMIVISGTGGGVGLNCSPVRPRGSAISGTGGMATGAVSLMDIINGAGEVIKAGGGRRTALMLCLNISHGDLSEFLDKKLDLNQLNNANVSVVFDEDPREFFEKVKRDEDFIFSHNGREVGRTKAKALWHKIVANALKSGEPGVLNIHQGNKMSNIHYDRQLTSTNPCFAPETMVQTRQGHFKIKDLVGKVVDIWNGVSWQQVDNFRVTAKDQPILKIIMQDGSYERVTPYHTMILNGDFRTKARDLKPGDKLAMSEAPLDFNYVNFYSDDIKHYTVARVLDDGVEPEVYCCTVVGNHTFGLSSGVLVGNCGEIQMSAYDCCCLGALVLPRFISDGKLDFKKLESVTASAVRFLDDVLTVNNYPLPAIAQTCSDLRRLGLGIMGLHDMLLMLGLRYNSPEGLELVDKVMSKVKNAAYMASTHLAKEKGSFPIFIADKVLQSGFVKTLKPSVRAAIKQNGLRNCALLTIAPTGTTSMVAEVSSGLEPMFAPAYLRRYRDNDRLAEEVVIHPLFRQFMTEGRDVSHFQGSHELSMRDHFEMQTVCQRHIDNAVSKTINVPQGTSIEELSNLYMEYLPELKGVTVYPEGSRENQPLTPMTLADAIEHTRSQDNLSEEATSFDSCKNGSCDI